MRENEPARFEHHTFSELMAHARSWKNEVRGMTCQGFSKLGLMRLENERLSLFAISPVPCSNTQTIFSVPIPLELVQNAGPQVSKYELKLKPGHQVDALIRKGTPSAEFTLMCERQRAQLVQGISDYEIRNGMITLMAGDQLFRYNPNNEVVTPIKIGLPETEEAAATKNTVESMDVTEGSVGPGTKGCSVEAQHSSTTSSASATTTTKKAEKDSPTPPSSNFVSSAKVCPADSNLLAYVLNKQVYIEQNGKIIHHTTSTSKHITNGVPSYIVQEELERFDGIWWSDTKRRLLYEQVNEEGVANAQFGINGDNPAAPMKYPRAGTQNSSSTLRMIVLEDDKVYDVALNDSVISKHCHNYEYITRAGFFSDGETVWIQVMTRDQSECTLILVPFWEFSLPDDLRGATPTNGVQLVVDLDVGYWDPNAHNGAMEKPPRGRITESVAIHRSRSDYWINTHNAIYPLKIVDEENPMYEFIYCLEKPDGSCLSLLSAELDQNGYCRHTEETLLMAETYSINKSMGIVVDQKRELVYYVANESHPTEWNICVSHYRKGHHSQLTESGICFKSERANGKLALDLDHGFACWMTSVGSPAQCRFYSFKWNNENGLPTAVHSANIYVSGSTHPPEQHVDAPEMIEFQSRKTGLMHFAMILRPQNFDPNKKYPVFHYVYGGPGIQIVHNDYTWVQFIRFCRLGYVVVLIDNRGSAHRGIEFERHISRKMGTVEVEDQVEGLQLLAERTGGYMDMNRVVVHGWSYGGYMALQMLAKHPKIYRAAIAGGAVSDWRLYDTAYTERYMGYPVEEHVYSASSITCLVEKFPDEPNRLMLVHGLMDENVHFSHLTTLVDECIKRGKWHELVIFPHERHGVRNNEASIYLDARMMYFAQTAIQNIAPSTSSSSLTDKSS